MRVWVERPGLREVALDQTPEPSPGHSSTPPSPSCARHVPAERLRAVKLAWDGAVVQVALEHTPQPATDHGFGSCIRRISTSRITLRRARIRFAEVRRFSWNHSFDNTDGGEPGKIERRRLCKPLLGALEPRSDQTAARASCPHSASARTGQAASSYPQRIGQRRSCSRTRGRCRRRIERLSRPLLQGGSQQCAHRSKT